MSKVRAEQYTNRAGSGAPEIPYGVTVPEGASIDGAGGLNLTGIATAGSFKGNLTGDVSGNVTGLAATFTGPVTIGGTLTYEDVTNIDAVGVITARDGLKVTSGGIDITGNIGLGGATYGTAGQVLTSGGSGANATWTSISAAPEISSNAAENINAGSAVVINSSGQLAGITSSTIAKTPNGDGSGLFTSNTITGDGNYTLSTNSANNKYRNIAFDPDNAVDVYGGCYQGLI